MPQQLEWEEKYSAAVRRYLEFNEYEILEDCSDDPDDPYMVVDDKEDNSKVFILLQAWSDELPSGLPPKWRRWCEKQMAKELEHLEHSSIQKVRFDVIDMLIGESRALLRHHVNVLGHSE